MQKLKIYFTQNNNSFPGNLIQLIQYLLLKFLWLHAGMKFALGFNLELSVDVCLYF